MFKKKKNLDEMSVQELEKAILIKRRQARLHAFKQRSAQGESQNAALLGGDPEKDANSAKPKPETPPLPANISAGDSRTPRKKMMDAALLAMEVVAVVGLIVVLVASYFNLQELNDEVSVAQQNLLTQGQQNPVPAEAIAASSELPGVLPGGHSPPTADGGAAPEVPAHLQNWVQPTRTAAQALPALEIEQISTPPTRIVIPKINVDAPIVHGVTWDDLKMGVGHLPGSANPGERGNLYLAAHNDIYGEIFRYLEELEIGDEYFVYAGDQKFHYIVKERRIIEPHQTEVMLPTTEPVATLQTCYPYMVNTHRLVVIGELVE